MPADRRPTSIRDRIAAILAEAADQRRAELEAYARALDLADPGGDQLPDGESLVRCTNGAAATVARFGGRVVGYGYGQNPPAQVAPEGHDFALVDDDRFLVDPWGAYVALETPKAVFDLHDQEDAAHVRVLYGDAAAWTPLPDAVAPEWTLAFNRAHRAASAAASNDTPEAPTGTPSPDVSASVADGPARAR